MNIWEYIYIWWFLLLLFSGFWRLDNSKITWFSNFEFWISLFGEGWFESWKSGTHHGLLACYWHQNFLLYIHRPIHLQAWLNIAMLHLYMMYRELEERIHKWRHRLHSIIGSKLLQGFLHLHLFVNLVLCMSSLFFVWWRGLENLVSLRIAKCHLWRPCLKSLCVCQFFAHLRG